MNPPPARAIGHHPRRSRGAASGWCPLKTRSLDDARPVVMERFESTVLTGNAAGDPRVRNVPLYLPPSYDTDPGAASR
jgi:hypothetical protein